MTTIDDPTPPAAPLPLPESLISTLPGRYYTDPDIFELEQEKIFEELWICAVRAADLDKPGSFRTVQIGRESVIITRTRTGAIKAYLNVCAHRGARICMEDKGEVKFEHMVAQLKAYATKKRWGILHKKAKTRQCRLWMRPNNPTGVIPGIGMSTGPVGMTGHGPKGKQTRPMRVEKSMLLEKGKGGKGKRKMLQLLPARACSSKLLQPYSVQPVWWKRAQV